MDRTISGGGEKLRIAVINGPNMNLLGIREPEIYGRKTYSDLCAVIREKAGQLGVEVGLFQSNHEGRIVDLIGQAYGVYDGIVINPAAYTHTSVAIRDAIAAVGLPAAEVHISDPDQREPFRKINFVRDVCVLTVSGHGIGGYCEALEQLAGRIREDKKESGK